MSRKISDPQEIKQFIKQYTDSNLILEEFDSIDVFNVGPTTDLNKALQALETTMIKDALHYSNGNKTRAAHSLGISRQVLLYKLRRINQQK